QAVVETVFLVGQLGKRAIGSADHADAHAHLPFSAEAVGVADGDGPLAATGVGAFGEGDDRQIAGGNLEHRQVGAGIGANHDRGIDPAIIGGDPEALRLGDHVFIGDDVPI